MSFFKHRDYQRVAKQLTGKPVDAEPSKEAIYRAAISRSYYSAFLAARELLSYDDPGILTEKERIHEKVHERLRSKGGRLRIAGENLRTMKYTRCDADYDLEIKDIDKTLNEVLLKSDNVTININDELRKMGKEA